MAFGNSIINTLGTLGVSRGGTNLTSTPTNGQLLIGNGTDFTLSTLTAGSSITITNSSGSVTIAASAGGAGFTSVVTQVFTSSGTYTPTTGMDYCIVEVVGGGGGSGGIAATTTSNSLSPGGGGGGYARKLFASATIGVSQTVTIGAGGTAGAAGNNNGGAGGTTSLGSLISATGGNGSTGSPVSTTTRYNAGATGGTGSNGDFNLTGSSGFLSMLIRGNAVTSGAGGESAFGGSARGRAGASGAGLAGENYGGGAGGAANLDNQAARAGGAGSPGIIIITEFIG